MLCCLLTALACLSSLLWAPHQQQQKVSLKLHKQEMQQLPLHVWNLEGLLKLVLQTCAFSSCCGARDGVCIILGHSESCFVSWDGWGKADVVGPG